MDWKTFYLRLVRIFKGDSEGFGIFVNCLFILLPFVSGVWFWRQSKCEMHGYIVVIITLVFLWIILPMIKKIWELEDELGQMKKSDSE
jgi:hypothetical protein